MEITTETAIAMLIYAACCLGLAIALTANAPRIARHITNNQLYDRRKNCRNYGRK